MASPAVSLWPFAKAAGQQTTPATHVVIGAVILPDQTSATFDHPLATSSYGIAVCPNWNTTVYVTEANSATFTVRFGTAAPLGATLSFRLATTGASTSVTAGATSRTITHNLASSAPGWQATPSWNTTVWVSAKAANTITFGFGTPAPEDGGRIYYGRYNLALSVSNNNESVTLNRTTHTVTHGLNRISDTFVMPSWNTTAWLVHPLDVNTSTFRFGTPASSGATLDSVSGVPAIFTAGTITSVTHELVEGDEDAVGLEGGGSLELEGGGSLGLEG